MFPKLSRADETLPEDVADFIADSLKETEELPRSQIAKVTKALGREETLALLDEVERIESEGGLLVPDGSRRRTPGGVFFHLARQKLPRPLRFRIFAPPQPIAEQVVIPVQRPLKPPPPPPRGGRSRAVEVEYVRRGPRPATTTLPSQASDAPEGVHAPSAPASPSPVATGAVSPATSVTPPGAAVPSPPAKRRRIAPVRPRAEAPSADPSTETRTRTEEPSDADEAQPTSEPLTEPTPSSRRTAPLDRKAFVLALPHTMPVAQVLEAARQQGLQLSASYVYTLRKTHPEDPKSAVPHGADPAEPAAKARPVTRAPRNPGTRATPRPSTKAPPSERTRPSAKAPASTKASTSASPKARSTAKAQPATQARASARAPASIKAPPKASKTHSAPKPRPAAKARSAPKPQPAAKARSTAKASPAKRSRKSTDFLGDAIQSTVEQELSKLSPEERRRVLDLLLRGDRKKRK